MNEIKNYEDPSLFELIIYISYFVGLGGCYISSLFAATVVFPEEYFQVELWKGGLMALFLFALAWTCTIWLGVRNGFIEITDPNQ